MVLLREVDSWYGVAPPTVLAVTQRWQRGRERFTDVGFNNKLREPEWTAHNRHAIVHEWAHIFCRHRGDFFIMWRRGAGPDPFEQFINDIQERQCEYIAAYMLVKRKALLELRDASNAEIAAIVDVPEHLVSLRWYIWFRHQR